ncbi:edf7e636-9234-4d39-9322-fb10b814c5d1 [Sclerotinia trifoliorum]|uniref:Edf7e636-9234-4d39-9322-fb10b814c5d1 n=1 Tax=Sclerotinia trifoliorum TaxID=28548 RepID=A0A8H2VLT2_9HELO|nr:edf7e636-9234-4d39-9322-fb10b814c5d1 [Sclerotinia trifoliorum]
MTSQKPPATHPVTGEEFTIEATLAHYKVSRKVLTESSKVWDASLREHFRVSKSSVVPVYFGTVKSLELWFRIVHDTMVDELEFDFPREFMYMTKKLVYGTADHIKDKNPTKHQHLHLEHTIISALNGAKGNPRCKILKGLFTPVGCFLEQRCKCKKASLFEYCIGLSKTVIWPLESYMKKSGQTILDTFDDFECDIPKDACSICTFRLRDSTIERTGEQVQDHFDGLYLDCMNTSKPKDGKDVDRAFWDHGAFGKYSNGCRVQHDQPTWYWSFMGRRTQMVAHQAARQR